jgi:hypothetical protein
MIHSREFNLSYVCDALKNDKKFILKCLKYEAHKLFGISKAL